MALVEEIVSGGQTGADRAALDFASAHGIPMAAGAPARSKVRTTALS
jgi:hypothetical protein